MTPYQKHVAKWKDCTRCSLCEGRSRVVLAKGRIPCDVLFVGEAPGASEDSIGRPFVGPAGHLLDEMIAEALKVLNFPSDYRLAFTNLVACIPLGDDGDKVKDPPKEAIQACAPRLQEFIALAKPDLIVAVGKLSAKYLIPQGVAGEQIIHPAAILRADISQRGLLIQRTVVTLGDAFESLVPF